MFLQKRNDPENIYSDIKGKCTGKKDKFCLQIHNFLRDEIFPGRDINGRKCTLSGDRRQAWKLPENLPKHPHAKGIRQEYRYSTFKVSMLCGAIDAFDLSFGNPVEEDIRICFCDFTNFFHIFQRDIEMNATVISYIFLIVEHVLLYMLCWHSGYSGNEPGIEFKSIHSHIHCMGLSV
jgi:hypothetical protein